jgi:hypothetical protein
MMKNPFGPQEDPGLYSYVNLQKRVLQNVQAAKINDQIFNVVQRAFEEALQKENLPLARPERKRLLAQIIRQVLSDMLAKLEDSPSSTDRLNQGQA